MLWAHEHQPVSVPEVAEHFGLDADDAYSELYPLQGIEVAINEEFHNLGVVVDEDGEIFFDINPLIGRPRRLERSEAIGLLAVANAALSLPGMDVDALRTGVAKLEAALGTDSALAVDISEPEILGIIQQAPKDRACIRFDYTHGGRMRCQPEPSSLTKQLTYPGIGICGLIVNFEISTEPFVSIVLKRSS